MNQPSKVTTFRSPLGEQVPDWEETEEEALCSVELGETAKHEPYVKSVKAYGQDHRRGGGHGAHDMGKARGGKENRNREGQGLTMETIPKGIKNDIWNNGYRGGYFEALPTPEVRKRCHRSTQARKTFERGFMAGTRSRRKHHPEVRNEK